MKKFILIIAIIGLLAGCKDPGGSTHTHHFGTEWKSNATHHWHECEADGKKAGEALHTWGAWTQTTAPTLTTAGIETRECSICHKEDTPEIKVFFIPQPFSPDGDGVDDELTVNIDVESESEVISWHIEIREPPAPYLLFSEWEGEGMPPKTLIWDGLSASGELVQSASAYHFTLTINNGSYNYNYQGTIAVDVLVRREGDIFRIVIPINAPNGFGFASDSKEFISGVSPEIAANNEAILQRITEILNSPEFSNYSVRVKGHLNPSTPPGTTARRIEEQGTRREIGLGPLSEIRAKAIADYLADYGIESERLTSVGFGGTQTIIAFEDRDNWWKNRRIEFILEEL